MSLSTRFTQRLTASSSLLSPFSLIPLRAVSSRSFSTVAPSTPSSSASSRPPSPRAASTDAAQRSFSLRLYKALLRAHRAVLPEAMRSLGDTYVREEFKLHKTAKVEHLNGFFTGWIQYLEMLRHQAPGAWGQELPADLLSSMTAEQKSQLDLLQTAAAKLDEQWSGMKEEGNPVTIANEETNTQNKAK